MKRRNSMLCALPVIILVCSPLPAVAEAQFSQQGAKLVGTGAVGTPEQGTSVALSGDGNTAIVGGPRDNSRAGAVWVYTRIGGVWTEQGTKLVGTGAIGDALQGTSVALSDDGNTAIVGGEDDNGGAGAAWVYTRKDGVWTQPGAKLVGRGAVGAAAQGVSVALSGDGNTAIVGGPFDNAKVGAAWVFAPFAGTPGSANCYGQSVSTLARQYRGLNAAASALGYSDVAALQNAIVAFCGG